MSRSEGSGDPAEDEPTVPAELAESWRTAEARLFGALLNGPDFYQAAVAVVGETVDRLRLLGPSTTALRNAAPTIGALVRDGLERGSPASRIDPELAGRAALAMRHREIVAEQASMRRAKLLAAARAEQLSWVVLEESGDRAGDPFLPYRRLEADATTGHALLVTADPDEDFRTCQHAVEVLRVDVENGRVGAPSNPSGGPFRCQGSDDRYVG